MLFKKENVSVRQLQEADIPLLTKWLSDPTVLEFYEGRDRPHNEEMVRSTFVEKKSGDPVLGCIITYEDQEIGYIQFYPADEEDKQGYGYTSEELIYGMDQFIGEPQYWNKGIGTCLVTGMVQYLLEEKGATKVIMDPQVRNTRAIHCYEKCGFEKVKFLPEHELHEGVMRDCWLIEYTK
jgi:aminoglycoside 6'-N-acetyltransferase